MVGAIQAVSQARGEWGVGSSRAGMRSISPLNRSSERRRRSFHRRYGGHPAMSVTDQLNESRLDGNNNEPRLVLDLDLIEAQALRAWLLETEVNGLSAQDTPVVNTALAKLG